ncbi:Uncharacterised protein [Mycobacteroides abscessus subsp. abscessus]|uniref:hypothetical protein n=1 Tax=Mycobacteroides abscessus TaxID=36809 RepID=UPI0009275BA5|nr:hypothetical protein [Mycobacteroides abscessus]SIC62972.1 Uncharacterised protein [Mycobacteroides abscessus subsp. abscessus]SIG63775.1 Uncharacterised protein [Mycobacteroides abscessus subsp. abscessus]
MSAELTRRGYLSDSRWYALQHFAIGALGLPRDYLSPTMLGLISRWEGRHPRDGFRFAVLCTMCDAPLDSSLLDLTRMLVAEWTRYRSIETGMPFTHWQTLLERQSDPAVVAKHTDRGNTDWLAVAEEQLYLPSAAVWLCVWRSAELYLSRRSSPNSSQLERLLTDDFDRFDFSYAARSHRQSVERFNVLSALVKAHVGLGGLTVDEVKALGSDLKPAWKTFYSIIAGLYCSPNAPGALVADAVTAALVEQGLTRSPKDADHWWSVAERRMSPELVEHFTVDGEPIRDLLAAMYEDLPAVQAWRGCAAA